MFIRLTGCHLRCTYCDTEYAFYEGDWRTIDDILETVGTHNCPFVEVTGGEPLLQPNVYELFARLLDRCETVAVETSGAVSIARVDSRIVRIVDLKTPSSGEVDRNHWENIDLLTPRDEVKFVLGDRADYEWARDVIGRYDLTRRCPVLMAPVTGQANTDLLQLARGHLDPRSLATWILDDRLNVHFGLQLHKIIWSPETRGV